MRLRGHSKEPAQSARPIYRVARAVLAGLLLGSLLHTPSLTGAQTLPPSPCTEATERGTVDIMEFLQNYVTPEGHFTIWYGLDSQRVEDPTGMCFPPLYKVDNAQKFVANVGALLEQVYSFYAGDYATAAFPGLGFDLPPHMTVKLYNSDGSKVDGTTIRLKIHHVYVDIGGEYRFLTHTILHELIHIIQEWADVPDATAPLLDWLGEGQARYANWFLGSRDEGTGEFLTYFGSTPMQSSFWDLSETLELGSYHFGGRFWRFLTYGWPAAGISELDREAATHQVTLPYPTSAGSIYKLRPRRGIYLLQDIISAVGARVDAGTCPTGDECFRSAVDSAIGAGDWARRQGNLYTYDQVYRGYAATNVDLEGPDGGHPLFGRFRGKFKSSGLVKKRVNQAVIGTYEFETSAVDSYTVLVTASAENETQNDTGDDDDLRFELDGFAFGGWDSADSFNGNALDGLTAVRFLRTDALGAFSSGLPAGDHTLTVYGDETPALKQVRVVRDDIQPVLADEWIPLTHYAGTAPGCNTGFDFHTRYEVPESSPLMMLVNSTLRPQDVASTVFRVNGATQWYPYPRIDGTVTYQTDAPQVLKASRAGGVPLSLRTELPAATPTWDLDVCTASDGSTELHTIDSLYLYPIAASDLYVEVHGHLHEYSTQYEVFMLDPQAAEVEVSLVGTTSGRFLNVTGESATGDRTLLSPDVWQPTETPPFSYTLTTPGLQYRRLIVGVGAYSFEGYDPALIDVTQRATIPYTLRIVTRYGPSPNHIVFLPLVVREP